VSDCCLTPIQQFVSYIWREVKQTPTIKTPNSTIVNCYEKYLKQTKVEAIADLKRINSAGITVSISVLFCSVSYGSNSNVMESTEVHTSHGLHTLEVCTLVMAMINTAHATRT
jgi:hypothetical protein